VAGFRTPPARPLDNSVLGRRGARAPARGPAAVPPCPFLLCCAVRHLVLLLLRLRERRGRREMSLGFQGSRNRGFLTARLARAAVRSDSTAEISRGASGPHRPRRARALRPRRPHRLVGRFVRPGPISPGNGFPFFTEKSNQNKKNCRPAHSAQCTGGIF